MNSLDWLRSTYHAIPLDRVIESLAIAAAAALVILYLLRFAQRLLMGHRQRLNFSYESVLLITRSLRVALWIGVGFLILSLWGVGITGLWTALVSVAAIVGVGFLAVWTIISNITASLFLAIWRPFHLGSTVEILPEKIVGKVVDTNMMFSVMREETGSILYIPNNMFFQKMFRVTDKAQAQLYETVEKETLL